MRNVPDQQRLNPRPNTEPVKQQGQASADSDRMHSRRTIQGFEAMLWLRKGFGFAGAWTVCEQNRLCTLLRSPAGLRSKIEADPAHRAS